MEDRGRRDLVLGVDVGGTFTDAVVVGQGVCVTAKVPSSEPQAEGVIAAARAALAAAGRPAAAVGRFVHGMTVATNALLERKGASVVIVTTEGFADLLGIARQDRETLYTLYPQRPLPLVAEEMVVTVRERVGPEGVRLPLADSEIARVTAEVAALRPGAVAVCLLWSFTFAEHERRLAAALCSALSGVPVVRSSELAPVFREYERLSTTVVDAYTTPTTGGYLRDLSDRCASLGLPSPEIMQSSGGTVPTERADRHAAHLLLSGPAGGVLAARALGHRLGFPRVLSFDMGGTSTDCTALDQSGEDGIPPGGSSAAPLVAPSGVGEQILPTSTERRVSGHVVRLPMVDIHTVSAGGGSIAWVDAGGALKVGPRSAGARPGPACYGLGGTEATVTDANLVLGRIPAGAVMGGVALDSQAAKRAVERVAVAAGLSADAAAEGILRVASSAMAAALRKVTIERGIDPRRFALVAYGGAGPLHACALAEEVGIDTILVPATAGVFSALGLASAARRESETATVLWRSDAIVADEWTGRWAGLEAAVVGRITDGDDVSGGAAGPPPYLRWEVEARYPGQSFELMVSLPRGASVGELQARFHELHAERYGYREEAPIEVVAARVVASRRAGGSGFDPPPPSLVAAGVVEVVHGGGMVGCPRLRLGADDVPGLATPLSGPLVVATEEFTGFVAPGWEVDTAPGSLMWRRRSGRPDLIGIDVPAGTRGRGLDAVGLELAVGSFHSLAEEMGVSLVRSARSANIKERRDASTAVFDREGRLITQAEHIPVHLGALPASVATVAAREQEPGDVWVLNHPYRGGTHLPDVTMVAPVFVEGRLIAFVADRAHHADIGGARPGSMPAGARSLYEEGLIIPPVRLRAAGVEQDDVLALIVANCRRPDERRGDLRAQAAALTLGGRRLVELAARWGRDGLEQAMDEVRAYSRRRVAAALAGLPPGTYTGVDYVEGDGVDECLRAVSVRVTVDAGGLVFDFAESADEVAGNVNCPRAVTVSACLFFARCLLDPSPLGAAGCAEVVDVRTRSGSLVDARMPHAVAGGNVETSQRVVDALLAALGEALDLPAASQGTMNNVTLGGPGFSYYETLGGGGGASREGPGADGIHSAMTNTMNTPVEAIERDFPLDVLRYELLDGSGGEGEHPGGRGLVRTMRVREAAALSVLAERQHTGAPGRAGGKPGSPGRVLVDGMPVGGKSQHDLAAGSVVSIETPGGGGWGPPSENARRETR